MSFLFASSHLPETRVQRPDELEDEEEDVQPMLHSGGVRAFSHLPLPLSLADTSGPLSTRPATPVGRPRPRDETNDDQDTFHTPGPDSDHDDDTRSHEYEDDSPWHMPRITAQDLPPQAHDEAPGLHQTTPWKNYHPRPSLDDMPSASRRMAEHFRHPEDPSSGMPTPARAWENSSHDLLFARPLQAAGTLFSKGSPGGASDGSKNTQYGAPAKTGSAPKGAQAAAPTFAAALPASPKTQDGTAPPPEKGGNAKATDSPGPSPSAQVKVPAPMLQEAADRIKNARSYPNPVFMQPEYSERTPLKEMLLLRELILSLRAPKGEELPLSIRNLQHWLDVEHRRPESEEEPVVLPYSEFSKYDAVKEGHNKLLNYFAKQPDEKVLGKKSIHDWLRANSPGNTGPILIPDTHWDAKVTGHASPKEWFSRFYDYRPSHEGLYYSMGTFQLSGRSSGFKGIVDPSGAPKFQGNIHFSVKDRYNWNKKEGVRIPITKEMLNKYKPADVPVISPSGGQIGVDDSFFLKLKELGLGRDYDIKSEDEPHTFLFEEGSPPRLIK